EEEPVADHSADDDLPLRQEIRAVAAPRSVSGVRAHEVAMPDRLRGDALVEQLPAVDLEVAGAQPVPADVDVRELGAQVGDPDRAGAVQRMGGRDEYQRRTRERRDETDSRNRTPCAGDDPGCRAHLATSSS